MPPGRKPLRDSRTSQLDLGDGVMSPSTLELADHPLKIGDAVTVFAYDDFGPFIEGVGTIDSHAAAADHYWIRFDHDPIARLRFVQADWQTFPDRSLALLRGFWRSCRSNESATENFFPHSSR